MEDVETAIKSIVGNSSEPRELLPPSRECLNVKGQWNEFVNSLRGVGDSGSLDAFIRSACEPVAVEGNTLVLRFCHDFHKKKIEDPKNAHMVETKLAEKFGSPNKIRCVLTPQWRWELSNWIIALSVLDSLPSPGTGDASRFAPKAIGVETKEGTQYARLTFDDQLLANAPMEVVNAIKEVRDSLIGRWTPATDQLRTIHPRLSDTTRRLLRRAEILKSKHILPGQVQSLP